MEQIVYFQGEDIAISAMAYEDNSCLQAGSLAGYGVDVLLYTDSSQRCFLGSNIRKGDFTVEVDEQGVMTMVLPSACSRELVPGHLHMEIHLHNEDGVVRIARCAVGRIEPSLISKIESYGVEG